jgi:hypothetical protein
MEKRGREERNNLFGLNIWWNLNRLRGSLKKDSFFGVSVFFHNFF